MTASAAWAQRLASADPDVVAVGWFGSYARGDAGVGSDIDLIVVRRDGTPVPGVQGADVAALPVPADVLHYTVGELATVVGRGGRMADVVQHEARWWVGSPVPGGDAPR